jgi:hypothetical protein
LRKYAVTVRSGSVLVSLEGGSKEEVLDRLDELWGLFGEFMGRPYLRRQMGLRGGWRWGRSEFSQARGCVEQLLKIGYFSQPRSTKDVRKELNERYGVLFSSRRVSQVLNYLYRRGPLSRIGSRGSYRFYVRM